jgi:xylulokinase
MMRGYFIGLDAGTSGVKALAVDAHGRLLASASTGLSLQAPQPGWAEQDPDAWWRAALGSLKALRRDRRLRGLQPEALGLSGQMHSSVFLDEAGKVIRPALLWCDGRTTAQCQAITKKVGEPSLRKWVSNPALEGFTLPKLLWLRDQVPAASL